MAGTKGPTPRNFILKRRETVKDLYYFRRLTIHQIVQYFKNEWTPQCVYNDIKALREQFSKVVSERDAQELIRRRVNSHDNIIARFWKAYDQLTGIPKEQAIILEKINRAEDQLIIILQELGFLVKPEQTHAISFSNALTQGYEELQGKMELYQNIAIKQAEIAEKNVQIQKLKAKKNARTGTGHK